ncbi:Polynucleotidyl transferase ribonuclease H-like superfamily protein [Euphorbia peplus]|nr:Polynucleotidyl transferase ribonuclease H-like superfamily protein [Euphorbia peplus]
MRAQWPLRALCRAYSSSSSSSSFPLKHVTKSNFEASLAELKLHVAAADFIAIDLEMTGVASAPWREALQYDRSDIRYLKVKDSAEKFAVLQFGVCPFRWNSDCHSFLAHPYNFFIFPRPELEPDGPSYEFLCQTASVDFLAKYQFDFNTCIRQGVSYLSRGQEEEALRRLSSKIELLENVSEVGEVTLASVTDVLFSERMKNRLSEWRDGLLRGGNSESRIKGASSDSKQQFETVFYKMRPALCLSGFTAHQLKLIQSVTKRHFKDLVFSSANGENCSSQQLVIYTESKDDKELLMKELSDENHKGIKLKIRDAVGFRHVIDLLSSEKKLIVGHNCILDIAHIYSKFLGPLPLTAEEFVFSVNKYFPHIVDTKILLNANDALHLRMKRSSTSLSSAFNLLCPQLRTGCNKNDGVPLNSRVNVEVQVDNTRSSNWSSGVKHEAGYDAFMTGCIFAQACNHLGIDFKLHSAADNLALNEKLQKYVNCLYLCWTNGDIVDLRTGTATKVAESLGSNNRKRHSEILFENIVLIWQFPSTLKAKDIRGCICKVFGPNSVTSVYHVDETAVFVQFSKVELVSKFLVLKEYLDRSNDCASVLHPLSKLLEGGNTRAAGYETYKEICSSPISKVVFAEQAEAMGIRWKTKLVDSEVGESFSEEETSTKSGPVEKNTTGNKHVTNNLFSGQSSNDELVNSFCSAERIRATNF